MQANVTCLRLTNTVALKNAREQEKTSGRRHLIYALTGMREGQGQTGSDRQTKRKWTSSRINGQKFNREMDTKQMLQYHFGTQNSCRACCVRGVLRGWSGFSATLTLQS